MIKLYQFDFNVSYVYDEYIYESGVYLETKRAVLKITLERRIEKYILDAFLPSLFFVILGLKKKG